MQLQILLLGLLIVNQLMSAHLSPIRSGAHLGFQRSAQVLSGLSELSGLTLTSLQNHHGERGQVIWGHNDSGNKAEVIALSTSGVRLLTVELPIEVTDLEDIDSAPCPRELGERTCLWLADVGDNKGVREEVQVHIFPVPERSVRFGLLDKEQGDRVRVSHEELMSLTFSYPAGERPNVEAMTISQNGTELWLFEKTDAQSVRVWAAQLDRGGEGADYPKLRVRAAQSLNRDQLLSPKLSAEQDHSTHRRYRITGADLSDDGTTLAIRTYGAVYLFQSNAPIDLEQLSHLSPIEVMIPDKEPQGEAVTIDQKGHGLWTASEQRDGFDQSLHFTPIHGQRS